MLPEIHLPDVTYVGVFLSLRCNFRCSYCINRHGEFRPRSEMTAEEWLSGLNRLVIDRHRMVPLTLQGGEPTIHREWTKIVAGIREDLYLDMLTNLRFDPDELIFATPPGRWERDVPYAPIRISYHPEQSDYMELLNKAAKLQQWGFDVGIFTVAHPDNDYFSAKKKAEGRKLDFRTKEFLGWHKGKLYGEYRYPEAVCGKPLGQVIGCETHELLIAPDGYIFRCHENLYSNKNPIGHLLDKGLKIEFRHRPCRIEGQCSACDVKRKTDRFQRFGVASVSIKSVVFDSTSMDAKEIA